MKGLLYPRVHFQLGKGYIQNIGGKTNIYCFLGMTTATDAWQSTSFIPVFCSTKKVSKYNPHDMLYGFAFSCLIYYHFKNLTYALKIPISF